MIVLVLGGARSGKSSYAERLARYLGGAPQDCCYLATGEAFDEEMRERIAKHRASRGDSFFTVEEPVHLARACAMLPKNTQVVLLDCLTTWMGNIAYRVSTAGQPSDTPEGQPSEAPEGQCAETPEGQHAGTPEDQSAEAPAGQCVDTPESHPAEALEDSPAVAEWLEFLARAPFHVVMVSNEVGLGLVPADPASRAFRDSAGRLNQRVAALADRVYFMVAGLPLALKGELLPL